MIWTQSLRKYLRSVQPVIPEAEAASSTRSRKRIMRESNNPLQVFEEVQGSQGPPQGGFLYHYLFDKGIDKILKKLGEEATEIVIAAKNPNPNEVKYEISDFLYHMMVLMAEKDVTWEEITTELANR